MIALAMLAVALIAFAQLCRKQANSVTTAWYEI